jgi:hypothetical protein
MLNRAAPVQNLIPELCSYKHLNSPSGKASDMTEPMSSEEAGEVPVAGEDYKVPGKECRIGVIPAIGHTV